MRIARQDLRELDPVDTPRLTATMGHSWLRAYIGRSRIVVTVVGTTGLVSRTIIYNQ